MRSRWKIEKLHRVIAALQRCVKPVMSTDFCLEVAKLVQKVYPERDVRQGECIETQDPGMVFVHTLGPRKIRAICALDGSKLTIQFHSWSKVADFERVVREALAFDGTCSICWEQRRGGSICGACGVMMCADCCIQYNEGARPYECHHCQAWLEPDMMRPIVDQLKADRLKADSDERLHADIPLPVAT